jgi:hypothetical protein
VLLNTALTDLSDAEARELALDAVAAVARLERRLQLLAEAFRIAESFLAADQFLVSGADTDEQEPVASVLGRPARIGSSD